jgi:hypothetical protein
MKDYHINIEIHIYHFNKHQRVLKQEHHQYKKMMIKKIWCLQFIENSLLK